MRASGNNVMRNRVRRGLGVYVFYFAYEHSNISFFILSSFVLRRMRKCSKGLVLTTKAIENEKDTKVRT